MPLPYEIHAIRYATRDARRTVHFVGGDAHDAPMPMDYFVWLVRNRERTVVVDTGFTAEMAGRRGRTHLRCPTTGLAALGVDAQAVEHVILTHLHYDHVGGHHLFPNARFVLQDAEMAFATGRFMGYRGFGHSFEPDEVCGMVRHVFAGRVDFQDGDAEIAPGLSVHRIGGHTDGIQCVRVLTERGWVVLASDTSHYYEHFERYRVFPTVFNLGDVMKGYERIRALAASPQHIVPGHDPLVMQRYPASRDDLSGIAVRLDQPPRT